jgi:Rieske Fe-S protein
VVPERDAAIPCGCTHGCGATALEIDGAPPLAVDAAPTSGADPVPSIGAARSRRQLLLTGGVVVAAAAVTAACGSSSTPATSTPAPAGSTADSGGSRGSGGGAGVLTTADVPVGGGTILTDKKIVVTQPTAGQFKAFTAVCTHRGCTVAAVSDGIIRCPCHGSQFSIVDGSVQGGPAPAPLAAIPVTVNGTTITVG